MAILKFKILNGDARDFFEGRLLFKHTFRTFRHVQMKVDGLYIDSKEFHQTPWPKLLHKKIGEIPENERRTYMSKVLNRYKGNCCDSNIAVAAMDYFYVQYGEHQLADEKQRKRKKAIKDTFPEEMEKDDPNVFFLYGGKSVKHTLNEIMVGHFGWLKLEPSGRGCEDLTPEHHIVQLRFKRSIASKEWYVYIETGTPPAPRLW